MSPSRAEEYYSNFGTEDIEEYVAKHILGHPEEMARFQAVIENMPGNVFTLLDVGCGPGVFLHLLNQQTGIKAVGIEITDAKIEYARKKMSATVLKGGANSLPFKEKSFDIVTALELMEHLPYLVYEETIEEMKRVAKNWILVSVPYREAREHVSCPYCGTKFDPNYHLRSFDEQKLQKLFPGFALVRVSKVMLSSRSPRLLRKMFSFLYESPYPKFAVCPACGFKENGRGQNDSRKATSTLAKRCFGFVRFLYRRKKQYRWMIALYERTGE